MLPLFLLEDLAMSIVYEPHPVPPERKKELRAKGLKIVDARFKPASEEEPARAPVRKAGK
jgi:hypothetical protein